MKTAMQQAIEYFVQDGGEYPVHEIVEHLTSLLPTEQQQIEGAVRHGLGIDGDMFTFHEHYRLAAAYFTNTFKND